MAATAPETQSAAPGWLERFIDGWRPGTGEPIEDREPATGWRVLMARCRNARGDGRHPGRIGGPGLCWGLGKA